MIQNFVNVAVGQRLTQSKGRPKTGGVTNFNKAMIKFKDHQTMAAPLSQSRRIISIERGPDRTIAKGTNKSSFLNTNRKVMRNFNLCESQVSTGWNTKQSHQNQKSQHMRYLTQSLSPTTIETTRSSVMSTYDRMSHQARMQNLVNNFRRSYDPARNQKQNQFSSLILSYA